MVRPLVLCLLLAVGATARAGTISGTVSYDGPAPKPILAVGRDEKTCGREVPNETLVVTAGALANVVVWLEGLPGPTQPTGGARLEQKACRYVPHVQAVTVGTELAVTNRDRLMHFARLSEVDGKDGTALVDWPLPLPDKPRRLVLRRAGVVDARCEGGHPWTQAYVHVFAHPFFAVTGSDGTFDLGGVPDGAWTLVAWHETLGRQQAKVEVKDGVGKVKLVFTPK